MLEFLIEHWELPKQPELQEVFTSEQISKLLNMSSSDVVPSKNILTDVSLTAENDEQTEYEKEEE